MGKIETRIKELGYELIEVEPSQTDFVPVTVHNGVAYISGQVPRVNGKVKYEGKVGKEVTIDQAGELAERCVLQALSHIKASIGSLDQIEQILKVTGYVQAEDGYHAYSQSLNAASKLLVDIFGERGRHARAAIGVAVLPSNTPIEIEFVIAVKNR